MTDMLRGYVTSVGSVVTPRGRLTYANLLKPNPNAKTKDGTLKYTTGLLLPPGSDLSLLKAEAKRGANEYFTGQIPPKLKSPFLDAYEKSITEQNPQGDERFKGWTLIRVSNTSKPVIIDARGETVVDPSEVYSGRWAMLSVRANGYNVDGNKGVSFFLSNVQVLENDDPFGRAPVSPEREFERVVPAGSAGAADEDPFA